MSEKPKRKLFFCRICGAVLPDGSYPRLCDDPDCEREYAYQEEEERMERHREIDREYGYGY